MYKVVGKKKKLTRSSPQSANHPSSPASIEEYLYYFSDDADDTEENGLHDVIATTTTNKNGASSQGSRGFRIEKLVDAELNKEDLLDYNNRRSENNNEEIDNGKGKREYLVVKREMPSDRENGDEERKTQPSFIENLMNNEVEKKDDRENELLVERDENTGLEKVGNNEDVGSNQKTDNSAKMTSYFVCLVLASTCGFLVTGYQMAVVSGLLLLNTDIPVTRFWRQTLVGITSAMALAITMTCGQLCDKIGRRYMVILSTVIAIIASSIETSGLYHNLPGRILAGMSIGLSCLSIPIYLAENTVVSMRGPIIMLNMAALTLGQFLSGIAAASFFYLKNKGWRFLSGIIILPSSLQLVAFFFLPESTRFLAKKGQLAKAQKVMNLLWKELPEKEFELMISDQNENKEYKQKSSFQIFMSILQTPPVRRALLLGSSLHIINQMSGINIIIFYSGMVVKMAGVYDDTVTIWLSTIPTLINFLGTFVGFYLVERIGRRLLLLTSTAGVIVSLIMVSLAFWQIEVQSPVVSFVEHNANFTPCGTYRTCAKCVLDPLCGFCYQEHPILGPVNGSCLPALKISNSYSKLGRCNNTFLGDHSPLHLKWQSDFCPSNFAYFIMAGQIIYLLFFASGLGSLPWTICSEIYPMWARGISNSISSSIMWLFSWLMTGTFLTLIQYLTTYGTFLLMACVTLIGWEFWFLCLPETKGKSLEEAELLFTKPFFKKIKLKTEKNEEPVFI